MNTTPCKRCGQPCAVGSYRHFGKACVLCSNPARWAGVPAENTFYFLPFSYGVGGFYALHPFALGRLHPFPFRILCFYSFYRGDCWASSRGVYFAEKFRSLSAGLAWLQDEQT